MESCNTIKHDHSFIGKQDFTTAHEKSYGRFGKEILWMLARKLLKKKMSCQPLEEYQLLWLDS